MQVYIPTDLSGCQDRNRMRFLTPALGVCQFTQSEGEWAEADMQSTPTSEENRDSRREIEELTGVRQNRIRVI